MAGVPKATTMDSLYGGAISLRQPVEGYRVNVDALILADFAAQGRPAKYALDLGAGVGSVALALHHLGAASHFGLIEREAPLLELAEENARAAFMPSQVWCCDLSRGLPEELRQKADLVVSNPPFFEAHQARQGPQPSKTRARFGALSPFLAAAAGAVSGTRARVAFVYPARELTRFVGEAERARLVPKCLRLVHADSSRSARVALIELRRANQGGLVILPPLFEWEAKGVRSAELSRILNGELKRARPKASDRK